MNGLRLSIRIKNFADVRYWLSRMTDAEILRCVSPERHELCDEAATGIYYQDEAEFYPSCDLHWPRHPQWSGHTRWRGYRIEVAVIPDKAQEWLASLNEEERKLITAEAYQREG